MNTHTVSLCTQWSVWSLFFTWNFPSSFWAKKFNQLIECLGG